MTLHWWYCLFDLPFTLVMLRVVLAFKILSDIWSDWGTFLNVASISVMIDPELQKGHGRERVIVIFKKKNKTQYRNSHNVFGEVFMQLFLVRCSFLVVLYKCQMLLLTKCRWFTVTDIFCLSIPVECYIYKLLLQVLE